MTPEQIVAMAREARIQVRLYYDEDGVTPEELERFAQLVAAHEREACAKVIAECADKGDNRGIERDVYMWNRAVNYCSAAIRARGEEA